MNKKFKKVVDKLLRMSYDIEVLRELVELDKALAPSVT